MSVWCKASNQGNYNNSYKSFNSVEVGCNRQQLGLSTYRLGHREGMLWFRRKKHGTIWEFAADIAYHNTTHILIAGRIMQRALKT